LQNHLAREIVLIGDTEDHVHGEALDLQQAVPLGTPVKIFAGTYKDAASSSIVIMTVGTTAKFSGSRLDMLAGNVVIVRSCMQKLMPEGFDGVLLIARILKRDYGLFRFKLLFLVLLFVAQDAFQDVLSFAVVEFVLPPRNDDGCDAVADEIGDSAHLGHESIHPQQ
jgi:hypothetical protein